MVKDGKVFSNLQHVKQCWEEYFQVIMNDGAVNDRAPGKED